MPCKTISIEGTGSPDVSFASFDVTPPSSGDTISVVSATLENAGSVGADVTAVVTANIADTGEEADRSMTKNLTIGPNSTADIQQSFSIETDRDVDVEFCAQLVNVEAAQS